MKRRTLLSGAPCAALGSSSLMSTLLSLKMANLAVADGLDTTQNDDRRTLVCVFLHGGIDSFNILVPRDDRHAEYAATRTDLAIPKGDLLALNQAAGGDGGLYGLNPGTSAYRNLFNGLGGDPSRRRLSFISNVGTLVEPTNLNGFRNDSVRLPRSLFSHSDQIEQWQTSVPQGMDRLSGWAGRVADVLHNEVNQDLTSMSLSFAGNNTFQIGRQTSQFVMTNDGALSLSSHSWSDGHPSNVKNVALKSLMQQEYSHMMEKAFADFTDHSIGQQEFVQREFEGQDDLKLNTAFPGTGIARNLLAALKMIKLRPQLGLRRQTIFIGFGGWDMHAELLAPQQARLAQLAPALEAFQLGLEELGLADSVITYTASDFARTLVSNGGGSDHAWGGNQLVFGGPVDGGKVLGKFPSLALGDENILDVGRGGRLIPTTSVDQLYAELLLWFGLSGSSNFDTVLPNLRNFYNLANLNPADQSTYPLGFLRPGTFA